MMIHNKIALTIIFVFVILTITLAPNVESEVFYGNNGTFNFFAFDKVLPQGMQDGFLIYEEVVDVVVGLYPEFPNYTFVLYNVSGTGITFEELESYFKALDTQLDHNENFDVPPIGGYTIPDCRWDYGTNQKVGMYVVNGQWFGLQGDPKC